MAQKSRALVPELTPKERLIFALDVGQLSEAQDLVKRLAPHVGLFKVGPRLFTRFGPQVIDLIHGVGSKLFLDLKLHDIPETVAGASREIAALGVDMFTVHALGGREMIRRVVGELGKMTFPAGHRAPACLAVTILTSHTEDSLREIGLTAPLVDHATRLAKLAMASGATGIVASGHELAALKPLLPKSTIFVVPGIRGERDDMGDQARTMTARQAITAGASYIVVGRPIRSAADPATAAARIVDEIEQVRSSP